MAKDPAVLFYTSDFLSGTFTMTDEQVGKYIRLLCLQHQKGKLTEKDMLSICKAYDEDVYLKFVNENGFFYNERMFLESERRKKYSDSRRKNAQHSENQSKNKKAYAKHMETVTETITENENRNKDVLFSIEKCKEIALADIRWVNANKATPNELDIFNQYLERLGEYDRNPLDYKKHFGKLKGKYPDFIKVKLTIEQLREIAFENDKKRNHEHSI